MAPGRLVRFFLFTVGFLYCLPLPALSRRVYVSAKIGNDSGTCDTVSAPCRTLTKAMTKVSLGGEVVILHSGDYDSFTVTKAVTITAAPGIYAGITAPAGHAAITVSAGTFDIVAISGLTLRNGGAANNGITATSAALLTVDHCVIDGFVAGDGISLQSGSIDLRDSTIRLCAVGLHFFTFCSICTPSTGTVEHCRFEGDGNGVFAGAGARVTIRNSVATQNSVGFGASGDVSTEMNVENCLIAENRAQGISVLGSATTVRVSNCVVTGNAVGLFEDAGGVLLSRKNNTVEGNDVDEQGHIVFYAAR